MWIMAGFVLMAVVAAAGGYFAVAKRQTSLVVGGRQLKLEVVKLPWQLQRGLSGRDDLPPDSGMLFIMPHRGIHSFWMKDMKFALDIVWLDDGLVVDLATLPAPTSTAYIPRHDPVIKADRVLELKAGMAQKFGLKPGVRLVLPD
jgi:uncharacterized membrane protein (UPF0127 family)